MTRLPNDSGRNSTDIVEIQIAARKRLVPLVVRKLTNETYEVSVDGAVRHADCSAEDVMRALGNYLNSISYIAAKAELP